MLPVMIRTLFTPTKTTRSSGANLRIGRVRARPIRKFAPLDRVVFVGVERVLVGKPAQNFARLQP